MVERKFRKTAAIIGLCGLIGGSSSVLYNSGELARPYGEELERIYEIDVVLNDIKSKLDSHMTFREYLHITKSNLKEYSDILEKEASLIKERNSLIEDFDVNKIYNERIQRRKYLTDGWRIIFFSGLLSALGIKSLFSGWKKKN